MRQLALWRSATKLLRCNQQLRSLGRSAGSAPNSSGRALRLMCSADRPQEGSSSEASTSSTFKQPTSQFCRHCGSAMTQTVPEGDSRMRSVCSSCATVDYFNPRIVVGAIVEHDGKILLCRRGIEPQRGLWTVPAGFLELGESTAEGAARETLEEAGAHIDIVSPYVHFDIVGIGQAYVLFRSKLKAPYTFQAQAPESLDAQLFSLADIPWGELAFSSVAMALRHYIDDTKEGKYGFHHGVIHKQAGSGPNDAGTFKLVDEFSVSGGGG